MPIMPSNKKEASVSNLREVLSHYLTGVTIVTVTKSDGTPYGLTVNSFSSVSLAPPLILWSLDNKNSHLNLFKKTAGFAINIMAADQTHLCKRFAGQESNRFADVDWTLGVFGQPLINSALAHHGKIMLAAITLFLSAKWYLRGISQTVQQPPFSRASLGIMKADANSPPHHCRSCSCWWRSRANCCFKSLCHETNAGATIDPCHR